MPFIRHCVECRKCLTRYLIAFSPYGNGSYLWRRAPGSSDEYLLYCFCQQPPVLNAWKDRDLKTFVVSKAAYDRGYGTPSEIVAIGNGTRTVCGNAASAEEKILRDT
jgi:hypothetical protein